MGASSLAGGHKTLIPELAQALKIVAPRYPGRGRRRYTRLVDLMISVQKRGILHIRPGTIITDAAKEILQKDDCLIKPIGLGANRV